MNLMWSAISAQGIRVNQCLIDWRNTRNRNEIVQFFVFFFLHLCRIEWAQERKWYQKSSHFPILADKVREWINLLLLLLFTHSQFSLQSMQILFMHHIWIATFVFRFSFYAYFICEFWAIFRFSVWSVKFQ